MTQFQVGLWTGVCVTLVILIVFTLIFGERDDDGDDDWNPWGGRHGR